MLARLFVIFGGAMVVVLCTLLLAPFFVDWAGYRSAFEREATRIIGQPVRVEGEATARILPFPSVTFSNVVIDGADGSAAARIAGFSMDAELAPFLSGEILIFDMRIERPDVRLKLAENGALLWSLPEFAASEIAGSNSTVSLENVRVIDGRLVVERVGQTPVLLSGINGRVSATALVGPWKAEGRFNKNGVAYEGRLSTGVKIAGEGLRLKVGLSPENGTYGAVLDGRLDTVDDAPVYTGQLNLTAFGPAIADEQNRPKAAEIKGKFTLNSNAITVADASFLAGPPDAPYRADGSASLSFGDAPRFDLRLIGQQLSFTDNENQKTGRISSLSFDSRLAGIKAALLQIPVPDMPGQVELALPALVVGDTIVRNAEVKATPINQGWKIERYSAELPGRTIIEGAGNLALAGELGFIGQMTVASNQPTGLVNWLGLKANDAIRALPGVGFSARVDISATRQSFRDFEFRAGAMVLRGLINRQIKDGSSPQLSIQLDGENADLNALNKLASLAELTSKNISGQAINMVFVSAPVSGFGFEAEKLEAKFSLLEGALTVEQFDVTNFAGADVKAVSTANILNSELQTELDVRLTAADPLPFIEAMAARFPNQKGLKTLAERVGLAGTALADSQIASRVKFNGTDLTATDFTSDLEFSLDSAGLRFNGNGALKNQILKLNAKGDADIGETFLASLGIGTGNELTVLEVLEPAAFEVSIEAQSQYAVTGTLKAVSNEDIFETGFGPGAQPFTLKLADAGPYALAASYGLPGAEFGLPVDLKGSWQKTGSTLSLQNLTGTVADVQASGALDLALGDQPKLTGNLNLAMLDRFVADEIVFGPLAASGDDEAAFTGRFGLPFDADFSLSIDQATGFAPVALSQAKMRVVANKNTLRLADISVAFAGGKLLGTLDARNNEGEVGLNFNGAIADAELGAIFGDAVEGKSNVQLELSANGSNLNTLKSSIIGTGVVLGQGTTIDGLSTNGFGSLVAMADARETPPDAIATLDLAEASLLNGKVRLPQFQTVFTVTSGVARAPRTLLNVEGGLMTFEPEFDIKSGQAQIDAQLQFNTGTEVAAGVAPALDLKLSGAWNALRLDVGTEQLQGFFSQRALEKEELRVEAIQSSLIEKQRLRRENRYYQGLIDARAKAEADRVAAIEQAAKDAAIAEKQRLEAEARKQAEEAAKTPDNASSSAEPKDAQVQSPNVPALNLDQLFQELETAPKVQP